MTELFEVQHAIERLPAGQQLAVAEWLQELLDARARADRVEEPRSTYQIARASFMSVEEFLKFEEASPVKHEYINGAIHAMTGASRMHNEVTFNLASALRAHLRGGPCKVYLMDLKLHPQLDSDEIFYYPDVMVDCRPGERGDCFLRTPKLVVEVLAPSTQMIDRREKALTYRAVESIEEYVIAAQDEPKLIVHDRATRWSQRVWEGMDAVAELRSIGLTLPLQQIYGDVIG